MGSITNYVNRVNVFQQIMVKDGYGVYGPKVSADESSIKCVKKDQTTLRQF